MLIPFFILVISFLSLFVSPHKFKHYMYISAASIAFFVFFIWPDNGFDLYRNLLIVNDMGKLNVFQLLHIDSLPLGELLPESLQYLESYPLYSFISWIAAKSGIYQLLPACITFIVYFLAVRRIGEISKKTNQKHFATIICFFLTLISYNYLFIISNLRYPLVGALFSYAFYNDVVEQKGKLVCYFIYIILPLIHSIGFLFIALRLMLIFYNRYTKWPIIISLLGANYIFPPIAHMILPHTSGILNMAIEKYIRYTSFRQNIGGMHVSTKLAILYLIILFIVFVFEKQLSFQYYKYCGLIICTIMFAFSMTNQSDIFNRMEFILLPLGIPIAQELISQYGGYEVFHTNFNLKKARIYQLSVLCFFMVIAMNFFIACKKDYMILEPYTSIDYFMQNGNLEDPW